MSFLKINKQKKRGVFDIVVYESESDTTGRVVDTINIPLSSSLCSGYKFVFGPIEEMSRTFGKPFVDLIEEIISDVKSFKYDNVLDKVSSIVNFSSTFSDLKNADYNKYLNEKKRSKTSIFFDGEEIRKIIIFSLCLKIYSLVNLSIPSEVDRRIKSKFVNEIGVGDVLYKIYNSMKSRIYRSSLMDKGIWELIRYHTFKTPDEHSMKLFNHFCNDLFPLLDPESNPISYIVKITDDSIRWLLSTSYKNKVIFGPESFVSVEDLFGSGIKKNIFYLFTCNDVLESIARRGLELLEYKYKVDKNETMFYEVRDLLDSIVCFPPASLLVLFPILKKELNIPYKFVVSASPRILTLVSYYFYESLNDFRVNFPILSNFLGVYTDDEFLSSKSLYRYRSVEFIINDDKRICGFNSIMLKYDVISKFCGVLLCNKRFLKTLVGKKPIPKFNSIDLEKEVYNFIF